MRQTRWTGPAAASAALMIAFGTAAAAPYPQPGGDKPVSLAQAWIDLLGPDEAAVARATLLFGKMPDQSVAFLKSRLRPVADDAERVQRLIEQLDDKNFQVRSEARLQLEYLGKVIKPRLESALAAKPSLEAKARLQELLDRVAEPKKTKPPPPLPQPGQPVRVSSVNGKTYLNGVPLERYLEPPPAPPPGPSRQWLRAARAIAVLEFLGTPDAVRFLEELAGGDPDALPTAEARAALARLKKK